MGLATQRTSLCTVRARATRLTLINRSELPTPTLDIGCDFQGGVAMKSQKTMSRRRTLHAGHAARPGPLWVSVDTDHLPEPQLDAQDGDSVPQPIEDWADDDEANQWLHEHRFDGRESFDIH